MSQLPVVSIRPLRAREIGANALLYLQKPASVGGKTT